MRANRRSTRLLILSTIATIWVLIDPHILSPLRCDELLPGGHLLR